MKKEKKLIIIDIALPVAILLISTVLFTINNWDMDIQKLFYDSGSGWFLKNAQPWKVLYHYSNIPALVISVSSLLLLGISFFHAKLVRFRKILLFLTLVMAFGPGLIINSILKDNWGRPRPRNIVEFGGNYQYEQPLQIDLSSKGKSFPCGHASMGFYLMSFFFIFRKRKQITAYFFLLFGITTGSLIGMARIVQGGHFASDVIWSGGIVYLVTASFYYLLGMQKNLFNSIESKLPIKRNLLILVIFVAAIILALLMLMATPHEYQKNYQISTDSNSLEIQLSIIRGDVEIITGEKASINLNAKMHGFPWSKLRTRFRQSDNNISLKQRESSYFSEVNQTIIITLPDTFLVKYKVSIGEGNLILDEYSGKANIETELKKGEVISNKEH